MCTTAVIRVIRQSPYSSYCGRRTDTLIEETKRENVVRNLAIYQLGIYIKQKREREITFSFIFSILLCPTITHVGNIGLHSNCAIYPAIYIAAYAKGNNT